MSEYRKIVTKIYNKQYTVIKYFAVWELPPNTPKYLKTFYKLYFWYFFIFWILLFDFVMIMQVITNIGSIEEVIKVLVMLATAIGMLGKILTVKIKNQSYENLFKLLLNKNYLPENLQERKIFLKCIDLNEKVRNLYAKFAYLTCFCFTITQYSSDTKYLPVNIYVPMGLDSNWKYNFVYFYIVIAVTVLCFFNVAFDSLASSFFIHLKGQLDILGHRLENIGQNQDLTQDFILQQLKDCMRYYNRILQLLHDIEYLVSIPISLQIGCSVFVLIANFYAMSLLSDSGETGKMINIGIYQCCMMSQIFIMCYYANEVSLKSSELSFYLYKSEWYNWNKNNRKLVLLMMLRFEKPMCITSINSCYSFNLAAFTSIVNSSYSYFALLKRINN